MTDLEEKPLVMTRGQLDPSWSNVTLPADDDKLRLYINASEDLMVASVDVREAGDWARLEKEIMTWKATASGHAATDPFVVGTAPLLLELTVNCTGDGTRDVVAVVDLGLYDPLRIPFRKTCKAATWYAESWSFDIVSAV